MDIKASGYLEAETTTTIKIVSVKDGVVEIWPPDNEPAFLKAGDTLEVIYTHKIDINA